MSETFKHISVMPDECIAGLNIDPNGTYVDCTVGGGGHSYLIAERLEGGKLIAIDHPYRPCTLPLCREAITFRLSVRGTAG